MLINPLPTTYLKMTLVVIIPVLDSYRDRRRILESRFTQWRVTAKVSHKEQSAPLVLSHYPCLMRDHSYGSELDENRRLCKLRTSEFISQLGAAALKDFDALKSDVTFPDGAVLFREEQKPRGVFLLCAGEVKLSISSSTGKALILRIARVGDVLGLTANLSGSPYESTAETVNPCKVAFLRSDDFLRFVATHPEAYRGAVMQLSRLYSEACDQLRIVGLSASPSEKLARLLLDWSADTTNDNPGTSIRPPLTHNEIAECIGTSRESVSRALSEFKRRKLVVMEGSTLTISNRPALEAIGSH
jgi:CRP/FNR family transcriptional regulator, cyclic AMP receptor protein